MSFTTRFNLIVLVLMLTFPFVFAAMEKGSMAYSPARSTQEQVQQAMIQLQSWNSTPTGAITFTRMWGSPMYVLRANTTQGFAGLCQVIGNRTSCITSAMKRGSTFPTGTNGLGIYDMAAGRMGQCKRGATKCVNNTFERCVGGFWVSAEQCKKSEVCTPQGCRIGRISRYPQVKISQQGIAPPRYGNLTRRGQTVYVAIADIGGSFVS
ncbi:MAG: hypothetical protein QXM31_00850 [Candidatus Woesearchaeota archaeon]